MAAVDRGPLLLVATGEYLLRSRTPFAGQRTSPMAGSWEQRQGLEFQGLTIVQQHFEPMILVMLEIPAAPAPIVENLALEMKRLEVVAIFVLKMRKIVLGISEQTRLEARLRA